MPLPLAAVISALASGGTIVSHSSGGLIVYLGSGYVAGTYLSTATVASIIATTATTLGVGAAVISGAASSIIGSAGLFGTTIGATGITGALMSAGILPSTPIVVPVIAGSAIVSFLYTSYRLIKLKRKITKVPAGKEVIFSEFEAKIIESIIKLNSKKIENNNLNIVNKILKSIFEMCSKFKNFINKVREK